MAQKLHEFVVLKSNNKYVYFEHASDSVRGYVNTLGASVFDPYAKIEVEEAKINNKYVHLRFCTTNKYWVKPEKNNKWIVASVDQAEEDVSKQSCTLFEPRYSGATVSFIHVQTGLGVLIASNRLCVQSSARSNFNIVDWGTLVKLPKRVCLKAHNDKYVRDWFQSALPYLQASSKEGNLHYTIYEFHLQPDGYVRIKSVNFDRFWRRSPNWVWCDSKEESGDNKDTLFWPTKINDNTIALQNAGNDHFVKPLTADNKDNCLNCAATTMSNDTRFVVEELVLDRSLSKIRYRMEDARVFDEQPFLAGTATAENDTDTESTLTLAVKYEETKSFTFTNSLSVMLGVETEIKAGFPFIAEGKIEISTEITTAFEWNRTTEETKSVEATYTVRVPPKTIVTVTYIGAKGKCSVPFSYTQRDRSSVDGQIITSEHIDGIYTGVDYYNYQFTQPSFFAL